jgi:hypothetical protein
MKAVKQPGGVNQTEFNDGSVVEKKPALIVVIGFPAENQKNQMKITQKIVRN